MSSTYIKYTWTPKIRAFQRYRVPVPLRTEDGFSLFERLHHRFQQKLESEFNLYKIYMGPKIRAFHRYRVPVPFRTEVVFSLFERLQHRFQQKLEIEVNLCNVYMHAQNSSFSEIARPSTLQN